jgi:hypothetical protein
MACRFALTRIEAIENILAETGHHFMYHNICNKIGKVIAAHASVYEVSDTIREHQQMPALRDRGLLPLQDRSIHWHPVVD